MKAKTSMAASDGADLNKALQACARGDRAAHARRGAASAAPAGARGGSRPGCVRSGLATRRELRSARGGARTWLYAVLRHRALNILRGEVRTDLVDDFEPMGLASEEENAEHLVARLSEAGALRRCLEGLEPSRRQAIVLAYVHGLSHGELAGRLGVPLGTVKSWIRRSLIALRECLA